MSVTTGAASAAPTRRVRAWACIALEALAALGLFGAVLVLMEFLP